MHGIGVSTVTAFTAHKEWATRPPDERFDSVHALHDAARTRRLRTETRHIETVDFDLKCDMVGISAMTAW